jgi:hypothetical protein
MRRSDRTPRKAMMIVLWKLGADRATYGTAFKKALAPCAT